MSHIFSWGFAVVFFTVGYALCGEIQDHINHIREDNLQNKVIVVSCRVMTAQIKDIM